MDNFLQELEQITQAYTQTEPSQNNSVVEHQTNTTIQNPENSETWFTTAAESQDYIELNTLIEADRNTAKIYSTVGSGLATLATNACVGNWALETTYNPTGYMAFSGVMAVALVAVGLNGSRFEGKKFYSSPWFLSSLSAGFGVITGAYAASRPYFTDIHTAQTGFEHIAAEIKEIEVKPNSQAFNWSELSTPSLVVAAFIALVYVLTRKK